MPSTLRQVLQAFEEADSTLRLDALARRLDLDPGTLDNMILYWVRKGRIVEEQDGAGVCVSCDVKGCPFIMQMPKRYRVVRPGEEPPADGVCPKCGEFV